MKLALGIGAGALAGLLIGCLLAGRYHAAITSSGSVLRCDGWTGKVWVWYPSGEPPTWYLIPDVSPSVATNR